MRYLKTVFPIILFASLFVFSCSSSGDMQKKGSKDLTLRQHLERSGGVSLEGYDENTRVRLRGEKSVKNRGKQPLFVVDGKRWGRDFYDVHTALLNQTITSVRVLSTPSMYGNQGAYGVIEIRTEKGK
ncbi:hypothetical protein [Fodinibius salinus]|uniref:hypothetical protein n=1 Tax=Fodinibius salinus TaxID=860790 RepID=UPI0011E6D98D|nr:hypothetical protein [Fodinibius salinus]